MAYAVLITRRTENPRSPVHRYRLNDEQGRARTFASQSEAEAARAGHLATFPADEAEVVEAEGSSSA